MGQESHIEHFGQGDVRCIVGSEIVPQSPKPREKEAVCMPPNGKVEEIIEGGLSPFSLDLSC